MHPMGNDNSNENWYFGQRKTLSNEKDDRISNNVMVQYNHILIYSIPGTIIDLCALRFSITIL